MGPSKSVLLVDSDNRSLRVLEVSLKKAGFQVQTAETAAGALQSALSSPPDLVVTDTQLPDYDGFELARRLKADPATAHSALIFLSQDSSAEAKISAINAGSEFYLIKPVLVRDILSRINELIERQQTESAIAQNDRPGNLSGTLANMGVVDLLQLMESGQKSGIVHLSTDRRRSGGFVSDAQSRGTVFFRAGQVIDARFGELVGLEAVYRMLLWEDGVFELEFKPINRDDVIKSSTQSILLEGMRRVDEWSKFAEQVPPLSARLALDYAALTRSYPQTSDATQSVLHLFDGRRSLLEVIDDAPMSDVAALEIISDLHARGVLLPTDRPSSTVGPQADVEEWLAGGRPHATNGGPPVPSVLGDAIIPSPRTPSEILGHQDARAVDTSIPEPQVIPQRAPKRRNTSIVLSRHTVPANQPPPVTSDVSVTQIPGATADLQRPTLTLKRMSSVSEPVRSTDIPMPAPAEGEPAVAWDPAPTVVSPEESPTVADMPSPGLSRPSWDQARAMVNEPVGEHRGTARAEGFVRAPARPEPIHAPATTPVIPSPAPLPASIAMPANPVSQTRAAPAQHAPTAAQQAQPTADVQQMPAAAQAKAPAPASQAQPTTATPPAATPEAAAPVPHASAAAPAPQAPAGGARGQALTAFPDAAGQAPITEPQGVAPISEFVSQPIPPAATAALDDWADGGEPTVTDAPPLASSETQPSNGWPAGSPAPTEPNEVDPPRSADTVPSPASATVPVPTQGAPTAPVQTREALRAAPTQPVAGAPSLAPAVSDVDGDDASRDFFKDAKSEVDIDWDAEGPAWKRRAPGLLLMAAGLLACGVLIFGGKRRAEDGDNTAAKDTQTLEWVAAKGEDGKAATATAGKAGMAAPTGVAAAAGSAADAAPTEIARKAQEGAAAATAPTTAVAKAIDAKASERAAAASKAADAKAAADAGPDPAKIEEAEKLVKSADRALRRERFSYARRNYQKALKLVPENAAAFSGLAMVWVNLGKDRSAQSSAWKALKLDRSQARAHLALALVYMNGGEMEKAKRYYKGFLRYQPQGKMADEVRRIIATLDTSGS